MRRLALSSLQMILASTLLAAPALGECALPAAFDARRALVVTDVSVVDDARASGSGVWSFDAALRASLPAGADASEAAKAWLAEWETVREVNGYPVTPRPTRAILTSWPRKEGALLDLARAPFRLSAFAFRLDLAKEGGSPGEGRLIFGAVDPRTGNPRELTVIFEFELPGTGSGGERLDAQWWAERLAGLGSRPFGDAYASSLEELTRLFMAHREDGSAAIAQVRTNDFHLAFAWELREFRPGEAGRLTHAPTAQTPDAIFDGARKSEIVDWAITEAAAIRAGDFDLPRSFWAGAAQARREGFRWLVGAEGLDEDLRHAVSLASCNGCHSGETGTRFLHVGTRRVGSEAVLSEFLKKDLVARTAWLERDLCGDPDVEAALPKKRSIH